MAILDAVLAKRGKKVQPAEPVAPLPPPLELHDRPRPPLAPCDDEKPPRKARTKKLRPVLPIGEESVRPEACAHCGGCKLSNKDTDELELVDCVPGYLLRRRARRTRGDRWGGPR